ncbi:MAG TPA: sulfate adenylyltransferase subunit CysN, partial [Phycisphaerae bacterium]|nr:sulfate adenylyltransferase subunit CysN [Phycisphaerae bacterium]
DTKGIYEDQLAAVKKDSVKHGTTGEGQIDLALLTDGLRAEREQGITIDVAYRYFSTDKRKFIIADTPGHEQYTRNMATGASTCQLAIILIDARHGIMTQTKRHSFITSLLGIKHLVVAINKMDLVNFSEETFTRIRREYLDFVKPLGFTEDAIQFIPMSALKGDNVVDGSKAMPWYTGPALLQHLETVPIAGDRNLDDLRFPVQLVLRPNLNFRGFAGTIASGIVRKGDAVRVLPSGKTSRVKSLVTFSGELQEAFAPMSITITLEDEIDVSRGDMLVHADTAPDRPAPIVANDIEAMVVWMNEVPFVPGKSYWFKQTTRLVTGSMVELEHAVDVNTLAEKPAKRLNLNEVGKVSLALSQSLVFDPYKANASTGAFIIIDRLSNTTVGAGMILGRRQNAASNRGPVSREEKEVRLGQRGAVIWASREIAPALERALFEEARTVIRLDTADLNLSQVQPPTGNFATLLRAVADQGILSIISSDGPPPPYLQTQIGDRLIHCTETQLDRAMAFLSAHAITSQGATGGEGI